jgi:bacterioferritin-associated ferredoxin
MTHFTPYVESYSFGIGGPWIKWFADVDKKERIQNLSFETNSEIYLDGLNILKEKYEGQKLDQVLDQQFAVEEFDNQVFFPYFTLWSFFKQLRSSPLYTTKEPLICRCFAVAKKEVKNFIAEDPEGMTISHLADYFSVGALCGHCVVDCEELIQSERDQLGAKLKEGHIVFRPLGKLPVDFTLEILLPALTRWRQENNLQDISFDIQSFKDYRLKVDILKKEKIVNEGVAKDLKLHLESFLNNLLELKLKVI